MPTPCTQADRYALIRPRRLPCIILVVVMCCPATLLADRVELKTGEVFFGKILRADRREVSMRLHSGGILSFRRNQVALYRKNYVPSDEWIPSPVFPTDEPTFDVVTDPVHDPPAQDPVTVPFETETPPTPDAGQEPSGGISLGTKDDLDPELVRPPVEDSRFRLSPPRGFLDWESSSRSSLGRFYDPVTQAELDIADLGPLEGSLEDLKKKVSLAHARKTGTGLRVLQDERVRDVPFEGWYFEFQEEVDETTVRRIWLFGRGGSSVLLLKYSCPEEHYGEFRRPFGESIRSFSPATTGDATTGAPPETAPGKARSSPSEDAAAELLRLLRSNQDRKKSKQVVDEFLNQEAAGRR